MQSWHTWSLGAALVGGLFVEIASGSPPSSSQMQQWLHDLDSDDYSVRETASGHLTSAGEAAIETLAQGTVSPSPEAAWRSAECLQQIALTAKPDVIARVTKALEQLSQKRPGLAELVRDLQARQAQLRREKAATSIRSQGGKLGTAVEDWTRFGIPGFAIPGGMAMGGDALFASDFVPLEGLPAMPLEVAPVDAGEAPPALDAKPSLDHLLKLPPEIAGIASAIDEAEWATKPEPPGEFLEVPTEASPPAAEEDGIPVIDAEGETVLIAPPPDLPPEEAAELAKDLEGDGVAVDLAVPGFVKVLEEEEMIVGVAGPGFIGEAFVGEEIAEAEGAGETLEIDSDWRGGDEGLASISDLPGLDWLTIKDAPLTDAALEHIAKLPRLSRCIISGTPFSADALQKFRKLHPETGMTVRTKAVLGINASDAAKPCQIDQVFPESGAAKAGLKVGDTVTAVDGQKVHDLTDLTIALYLRKAGEKVHLTFERDGKERHADVELAPRTSIQP